MCVPIPTEATQLGLIHPNISSSFTCFAHLQLLLWESDTGQSIWRILGSKYMHDQHWLTVMQLYYMYLPEISSWASGSDDFFDCFDFMKHEVPIFTFVNSVSISPNTYLSGLGRLVSPLSKGSKHEKLAWCTDDVLFKTGLNFSNQCWTDL